MEYYSQIGQDRLVVKYLKNKKNGHFIDIGCGYPKSINNTYLLETEFGWDGISIDLVDFLEDTGETWDSLRKTKRLLTDALKADYKELFKMTNMPKRIDYLSMDLEPPSLTLECLYRIPFDEYSFNIITFEVDKNREGDIDRIEKSRKLLSSNGYTLIGSICSGQDDVYVHNSLLDSIKEMDFKDNNIIWTLN